MKLGYLHLTPIHNSYVAESNLASLDHKVMCRTLVALIDSNLDPVWIANLYCQFTKHQDLALAQLAVSCLGNLVRVHPTLDNLSRICKLLHKLKQRPELEGVVEDALGDIEVYAERTSNFKPI